MLKLKHDERGMQPDRMEEIRTARTLHSSMSQLIDIAPTSAPMSASILRTPYAPRARNITLSIAVTTMPIQIGVPKSRRRPMAEPMTSGISEATTHIWSGAEAEACQCSLASPHGSGSGQHAAATMTGWKDTRPLTSATNQRHQRTYRGYSFLPDGSAMD